MERFKSNTYSTCWIIIFSYAGLALGWLYFGHISELQLAMIGTLGQLMAYVVVILYFIFTYTYF